MARFRKPGRPAPPSVDKQMSDLGDVRKVRFGLASKFTLPVSLVLSLAIVLTGVVVYDTTSESLQHQLNQQGVFAARIAAAPEIDSWDEDYNTYQDLNARIGRIHADRALARGELAGGGNGGPDPETVKKLEKRIEAHEKAQRRYNRDRLRRIIETRGSSGIYLDLWILNEEGQAKVTAGKGKRYAFTQRYELSSSPGTDIRAGTYTGADETQPARFFMHPVTNKDGEEVGKAVVVFSERGILSDLQELKSQIAILCVLAVAATAIVAFVSARIITRPLGFLMKDIRTVAGGDLEHRTRPRSNDELGTLAVAFDQMTRNLAAAEVMRVDLADKDHQVSVAHEVQDRLFPKDLPRSEGLHLDAGNRLAADLSADLFDVLVLEDGRMALVVMTASGRGVPAAIVLSMARSLFRARGIQQTGPAETLKAINALLSPDLRRGMYVSALYAVIDPTTGQGSLASAGHRVPALHYVAASAGLRRIHGEGIAIGLDKGPVFDRSLREQAFALESGDRLVLATEGAFLLTDDQGQPLGEEAFMRVVLGACKKDAGAAAILSTLQTRLGARHGDHDITLVMATRT